VLSFFISFILQPDSSLTVLGGFLGMQLTFSGLTLQCCNVQLMVDWDWLMFSLILMYGGHTNHGWNQSQIGHTHYSLDVHNGNRPLDGIEVFTAYQLFRTWTSLSVINTLSESKRPVWHLCIINIASNKLIMGYQWAFMTYQHDSRQDGRNTCILWTVIPLVDHVLMCSIFAFEHLNGWERIYNL
jgi:hypothetical protein